jgi:hypothetical protein
MSTWEDYKEMDFDDLMEEFLTGDEPWEILAEGVPELEDVKYWIGNPDLTDEQITYLAEQLLEGLEDVADEDWIVIDGELIDVTDVSDYGYLPMVESGRLEYYVAKDSEHAGEKNKEYWRDMAENDQQEFIAIVGAETLVEWALGNSAGPGSVSVHSLDEWLDLVADYPEEQWGGYDGTERDVDACSPVLESKLGFYPRVAYRWN